MKAIQLLLFSCFWLGSEGINPLAAKPSDKPIHQWAVHELTLQANQAYDNPYADVQITATFEGPEGSKISTTGYWNEDKQYKVRFTPTQKGPWTYRITSNPSDPGLQQQGKLQVAPATAQQHGFVRRDAEHPYHFVTGGAVVRTFAETFPAIDEKI